MQANVEHQPAPEGKAVGQEYPPLEQVTKPNLTTKEFCFYANLAEQTAWIYACKESGPIRPIRIGRRLNWPTKAVKQLCGVA
jgi:hypothetical protein